MLRQRLRGRLAFIIRCPNRNGEPCNFAPAPPPRIVPVPAPLAGGPGSSCACNQRCTFTTPHSSASPVSAYGLRRNLDAPGEARR